MIVHTTMRPDFPIDVDDAEYTDLLRQGLLLPPEPDAPDAPPAAAAPQVPPIPAVQPERDQEQPE